MAITKEQAIDILDKFNMFQGQRAGRELWYEKPLDVQDQDIVNFSKDVALLKEYINQAKQEVASKVIDEFKNLVINYMTNKNLLLTVFKNAISHAETELKKKYIGG